MHHLKKLSGAGWLSLELTVIKEKVLFCISNVVPLLYLLISMRKGNIAEMSLNIIKLKDFTIACLKKFFNK